jgi:uncharacterized membrane protein required for colicin V production
MNWLDGLIIIFLGITAFLGSRRGLTGTFFPLAVVVLAVFIAGHTYESAANWSQSWFDSADQSKIAAFIIIFLVIVAACVLLFWLARKSMDLFAKGKAQMSSTVIPIVGIILAIALAGYFYQSMANWLSSWFMSSGQASITAFAIIFIFTMLASTKILLSLSELLNKRPYADLTGKLNGLGGTILGLAIGGVVAGALLTIVSRFYYTSVESTMRDSGIATFLLNNFPFVLHILPKEFDIVRHLFS